MSDYLPQPAGRNLTMSDYSPQPAGRNLTMSDYPPQPAGRNLTMSDAFFAFGFRSAMYKTVPREEV
jgi:hypothetical protein